MKLSVPTLGRLANMGFVKVAGMNSLFRHPSLPWALFKRVNTTQQAIACGGVFTSSSLTQDNLGAVTIAMGQSARYLGKIGRLGEFATTGSFVAKGVSRFIDVQSRYTPAGQNWWSQTPHTQLSRMSPSYVNTGSAGVFLAVITKALDGMVVNTNPGSLDCKFSTHYPAIVEPGFPAAVTGRGLDAGIPATWMASNTCVGSRSEGSGWIGYIDFGIEVRMGELLRSRFDAWQGVINDADARKAMSAAFVDEFDAWTVNGKNDELHMLKNRAYLRLDGGITGVPYDGYYWSSVGPNSHFTKFSDSIAERWDSTRLQQANAQGSSGRFFPYPVATGMPQFSGFLDGTPLKSMDALLPIGTSNSGTYRGDSDRPIAGSVTDASGGSVSLFTALNGTLNYTGPVTGTGVISYATQLAEVDRLRDPLVYQKTEVNAVVDDSKDATIPLPADMGLAQQRSEALNSLQVSEMLRRAYDPLIGRVTEFDSRVHAKAVGADLGDGDLKFWIEGQMPGRTVVNGPATDVQVIQRLGPPA